MPRDGEGTALKFYLTQKLCCSDAGKLKMAASSSSTCCECVCSWRAWSREAHTLCVRQSDKIPRITHGHCSKLNTHNKIILSPGRICATGCVYNYCIYTYTNWKALSPFLNKPVRSAMINIMPAYDQVNLLRLKYVNSRVPKRSVMK